MGISKIVKKLEQLKLYLCCLFSFLHLLTFKTEYLYTIPSWVEFSDGYVQIHINISCK